MQPHIFIGIPAYRGWIKNQCTNSLLKFVAAAMNVGVKCEWHIIDRDDIATVRGFLATHVMERNAHTHLLFWDNDIETEPETVFKLLQARKPVIGAVCARRSIPIVPCAPIGWTPSAPIETIPWIGMALTLIEMNVFRSLAATGALKRRTLHDRGSIFGFFDRIKVGDMSKDEDMSFCVRWRELCNGEVWALSGEKIRHWGDVAYELPQQIMGR